MTTVADILRGRADSDAAAFLFGDDVWTYREVAEEAGRRAALFGELRDEGRPPHIGVTATPAAGCISPAAPATGCESTARTSPPLPWRPSSGATWTCGRPPSTPSRRPGRRPSDGAIELRAGAAFDPAAFDAFLSGQPDLGPKWLPSFVRVTGELPKLASMKVDKRRLRQQAWRAEPCSGGRPGDSGYSPCTMPTAHDSIHCLAEGPQHRPAVTFVGRDPS
jgi:hypothetical protein